MTPTPPRLPPPPTTLGERLIRFAYRAGVPASVLASPFRRPARPRITATVACPPLGDRVAGMALRAGHFLIGGARLPSAQAEFGGTAKSAPLMDEVLHGFGWLDDLAASATAAQGHGTAERIARAWLAANPEPDPPAPGGAWNVEIAARRLAACLVNAPLILSGGDKAYRAAMLEAIAETTQWLGRNAPRAAGLHGQALAFASLVMAGLLLPDGKPCRLHGEAGLAEALGALVGEDGGVLSRSPLAQADLLACVVRLLACYRAAAIEPPDFVGAAIVCLVPPLVGLADGIGAIGSWQGGAPIPGERLAALIAASGERSRMLREVGAWGYQRLEGGTGRSHAVLVCDGAPPPLPANARFGCASTLAFEFHHAGEPVIVNCGGAALAGGLVPLRIEQGLRASAAHSALVLDDTNSTATLIGGRLGKGVTSVEVDRTAVSIADGRRATRLDATHDGYGARYGLIHRRILTLTTDGALLTGEDRLEPRGRRAKRGKVGFAIRFHLARRAVLQHEEGARFADLVLPDGSVWRLATDDMPLTVEESLWVDAGGRPHETQQLVMEGLASRGGEAFHWQIERIG